MIAITGQLLALATAACWAHNSIMYSSAGKRVGSNTVAHIRLWIALPAILLLHLLFLGNLFPPGLSLKPLLNLIISGVLGFCIADLFIFQALVKLGPRETLVILTLSPIFSALFSWFTLKEQLSLLQISGILATIAGVIWVTFADNRELKKKKQIYSFLGLAFALLGTLSQAVAMVLAKAALVPEMHPVSANLIRIASGLMGLILFSILRGTFFTDFKKMRDRKALLYISTGSLVGPVLGIVVMMYALSLAPVGIVTALSQISPILLLPFERYVYKKVVPLGAIFGTLLALGGSALLFIF